MAGLRKDGEGRWNLRWLLCIRIYYNHFRIYLEVADPGGLS